MGLAFLFFKKLNYWLVAQNRHDIHSPFVFDFVEQIINQKNIPTLLLPSSFSSLQQIIIGRIIQHYCPKHIHFDDIRELTTDGHNGQSLLQNLFIYTNTTAVTGSWGQNDMVLVCNNNRSKTNQEQWQQLYKLEMVRLSIDLFELGILLFSEDFRVKQHFVLRT